MKHDMAEDGGARRSRFLGIDEAAAELRISRSGVYRAIERGDLRAVRIGSRRLIATESIDRLANEAA